MISSPASLVYGAYPRSKAAPRRYQLDDLGTSLRCDHLWPTADRDQTQDHVALLRFRSTATEVTVQPTYWMVNGPALDRNPLVVDPPLRLQRFPALVH